MRYLAGLICLLIASGCGSVPFQKTALVSMNGVDPQALVEKYNKSLPGHYQQLNSIMFTYGWSKFSALGYIDVNYAAKSFTVVSMNPMGVKLFELTGDEDGVDTHFMMKALSRQGDLARVIGEDLRKVYFDLVPSSDAEIKKKHDRIIFRQTSRDGVIIHVFAGAQGYLIEKDHYENNILQWRVSYYDYHQKGDMVYPGGIVLDNYNYGYRLIVKLKENVMMDE